MYGLILLPLLALAWLLWSGMFDPLLLGLGTGSCLLVFYLSRRAGLIVGELFSWRLLRSLPRFWIWLFKELVKSNLDVARVILHPDLPISATVVEIDAAPRGPIGQAILGNSITLTPGTVTLDLHEGRIRAHCLTRAGADTLLAGEMNRRAAMLTEA